MEKPPPPPALKPLSPADWESLFEDFQHGGASRRQRWTSSNYTGLPLLDLALSTLLRRDFLLSLKLNLLVFLEEFFSDSLFDRRSQDSSERVLARLVETLRTLLLSSPTDAALCEQMLLSTTSIFITLRIDGDLLHYTYIGQLQSLTELLLTVVNRPNHGADRQLRAAACECLRELETAYPCLLSEIGNHLWELCQSERTHAAQSYVLLLAAVVHSIVIFKPSVSILSSSVPLVPFTVPRFLIAEDGSFSKEISSSNRKGLKRAISFLLEWPQYLTPCGMMEFMSLILPVAAALDLQPSLLKVQFSGLLYTYDPLLCHSFLIMYSHFLDAFSGQEADIARRFISMCRESHHYLVFRLLALHWLVGLIGLLSRGEEVTRIRTIFDMPMSFYPSVYDPLSLKVLKLDLLAYCSVRLHDDSASTKADEIVVVSNGGSGVSLLKHFEDGLVSVSSFKWLPPWSTETAVAFRAFHKILIGLSSHFNVDISSIGVLTGSSIFRSFQTLLVDLALKSNTLVPVIVIFINRFLACHYHGWLGECLLQSFDEHLLPKANMDYHLAYYFPIIHRIAENNTIPPYKSIKLLTRFMVFLVEKHGPDTGIKSWSYGSKVLCICRTMITHQCSSRLFTGLSHLLAFTCTYFPDLEVRDNARIYLRMLVSVPGMKLKLMLTSGEQLPGITPSPQLNSYLHVSSPRPSRDLKKSKTISSYIFIERMVPLLVKQSWSLSLPAFGIAVEKPSFSESIRSSETSLVERQVEQGRDLPSLPETERIEYPQEPLRVTDSKISGIIEILRKHFSCIPDFRHMPGLKVGITCSVKFEAESFNRIWGVDLLGQSLNQVDMLPALYATVLTFSSSAPYGRIPSCHIPFLLGEFLFKDESSYQKGSLDIVSLENQYEDGSKANVVIELEPHEPVPGIIDVFIEANTEDGQIIHGQLQQISVSIEDMFLRAIVPSDMSKDAVPSYQLELFNALWEACGSSSNTGREAFPLNGGKGVAAISGTQSVKLLEVPATSLILAIERYLAHFVVGVTGDPLVNIIKDRGIIMDVIWKDVDSESPLKIVSSDTTNNKGPLFLKSSEDKNDDEDNNEHTCISRKNMGCFLVLIFLPPRFHLLLQMEVCDFLTLVRIRTDHWPCLAYIDDYLEALFSA